MHTRMESCKMSKHYTFTDCVNYARSHKISFIVLRNMVNTSNEIYAYISDGADGYLTATIANFYWDYFNHCWRYDIDLNVRYAYKKDYELARRICSALNHNYNSVSIQPNNTDGAHRRWYGVLTLGNESYIASSSVGDNVW